MNKSILIYAVILVLSLGASWKHYTDDTPAAKVGVSLIDVKKDSLQQISYDSPDLKVTFEVRKDDVGSYGWVSIKEVKKKKQPDGSETTEESAQSFKAGSAGDKLIETWAPLMAIRDLGKPDDARLKEFGLTDSTTTITVQAGGRTVTLELGAEVYGTKDYYVRDRSSGVVYVLDDEAVKSFKFAKTKLKDSLLSSAKKEEIEWIKIGRGSQTVKWEQKNIADRSAAFFARTEGDGSKDETFNNWLDKLLKVRSSDYLQAGQEPSGLTPSMDIIIKPVDRPAETVLIEQGGDTWYARGSYLRASVKLNASAIADAADEIDDVIEGKAPAEPAPTEAPPLSPYRYQKKKDIYC